MKNSKARLHEWSDQDIVRTEWKAQIESAAGGKVELVNRTLDERRLKNFLQQAYGLKI
jgi:hypothetical protein